MNKTKDKRKKKQSVIKKKISMILGIICYAVGVIGALYVGGWLMFVKPICTCIGAIVSHSVTIALLVSTVVKAVLASTMAGLIWCIGYVGYNYFKGEDDPDWESINAREPKGKNNRKSRDEHEGGNAL